MNLTILLAVKYRDGAKGAWILLCTVYMKRKCAKKVFSSARIFSRLSFCSEAGDLGQKYWGIRAAIGKYSALPPLPPHFPNATEKGEVGTVKMRYGPVKFQKLIS
jgi:hypothetical protein